MSVEATDRTFSGDDGITLAASEWHGDPARTRPVVLLLHGGGQTRHSWRRAGVALATAGYDAVALDCRGHGDSDWSPDGVYLYSSMTADVVAVTEQLGRPVALVGASMGGLVALLVSASTPDSLAALVLVDVVPRVQKSGADRVKNFMASGLGGFATLDEAAEAIAAYLPHRTRPRSTAGLRRNLRQREDGRWYWHWDPKFLAPSPLRRAERVEPIDAAAAAVTVPMLLVHGALSDVVNPEGIEHLRSLAPNAQVVSIGSAAHTAAGDDNDAFSRVVVDFLTDVLGSSSTT